MKFTITKLTLLLSIVSIICGFTALKEDRKVRLKVTKMENGEKTVFEKSYENMETLRADEELQSFDLLVEEWISNHRKGIIATKSLGGRGDFSRTTVDDDHERTRHIIIEKENGKSVKAQTIIEFTPSDGEEEKNVIILKSDGNDDIVWIDENGNERALTEERIAQLKERDSEHGELHKKVEVITSDDSNEREKKIATRGTDDEFAKIEVQVEKAINDHGEEVIREKKIWITKNGQKVGLDDENSFQFKTDGDDLTVIVDGKELDIADFSGGRFEGDKNVFFAKKGDRDGDIKQKMSVNVEEKNDETYIEIEIERKAGYSITISDIEKSDISLQEASFSIKNDLTPVQLNYYPNPNSGRFNLKFDLENKGAVRVRVLDILGNEVYQDKIDDFQGIYDKQLDLNGQKKGVYVLQVVQARKALSRKILIE
jgi:hypothetical protein